MLGNVRGSNITFTFNTGKLIKINNKKVEEFSLFFKFKLTKYYKIIICLLVNNARQNISELFYINSNNS